MFVARSSREGAAVLDDAHHAFQPLIGLKRDMLRVLVADGAELPDQLGFAERRLAESAGRCGSIARHRDINFTAAWARRL